MADTPTLPNETRIVANNDVSEFFTFADMRPGPYKDRIAVRSRSLHGNGSRRWIKNCCIA